MFARNLPIERLIFQTSIHHHRAKRIPCLACISFLWFFYFPIERVSINLGVRGLLNNSFDRSRLRPPTQNTRKENSPVNTGFFFFPFHLFSALFSVSWYVVLNGVNVTPNDFRTRVRFFCK